MREAAMREAAMRGRADRRRRLGARPRPRASDDDRVLPLINVVFLLLVVFMAAGRLAASDPFALSPPRSSGDGPPPALRNVLQIGAAGERALDGRVMAQDAALAEIARRLDADPALAVRVKADAAAPALEVVAAMEALRGLGLRELTLVTARAAGQGP